MALRNRDVFQNDPTQWDIPNDGVAKVSEPETEEQWRTLRHELTTFVYNEKGKPVPEPDHFSDLIMALMIAKMVARIRRPRPNRKAPRPQRVRGERFGSTGRWCNGQGGTREPGS